MKVLIVDMTHGGIVLALEFYKKNFEVFTWDIYETLTEDNKKQLEDHQILLTNSEYLDNEFGDDILTISPIHCSKLQKTNMTHHQAVRLLLENEIKVPVIEVTGVKGKTSTVHMLKEIFRDDNPLILSSTGVEIISSGEEKLLVEDISITPSNIITAWRKGSENFKPGVCIFETSLGGTGLADVGVLTNIVENYSIAGGKRTAAQAKEQIFQSKIVIVLDKDFKSHYSKNKSPDKVNTYSISEESNVKVLDVNYGFYNTDFTLKFSGFCNVHGETKEGIYNFSTFAPSPYHLENSIAAISVAFALGKDYKSILRGMENFKGLKGRTSISQIENCNIIHEINPGINTKAVQKSIEMIKDYQNPAIIIGGQYGITCEEIDEKGLVAYLDVTDKNMDLVLVDELGKNLYSKLNRHCFYEADYEDAINILLDNGAKNILMIYRSHFANIEKR